MNMYIYIYYNVCFNNFRDVKTIKFPSRIHVELNLQELSTKSASYIVTLLNSES